MATTTNYSFTTPDDTGLVKDGASAIRSLGSSIDTTTKALNPSTTLGDVEYRSSTANTNTRLGIGSTGQALTVSGGVPAWATINSSWSLVNSGGTALTGASTITVTGISSADKIMVIVASASSASVSSIIGLQFNTDTATNYIYYGTQIIAGSTYSAANAAAGLNASAASSIPLAKMATNHVSTVKGYCLISGGNTSGLKMFTAAAGADDGGGNSQTINHIGGYYNSATVISSVSIVSSVGNFDSGTIFIYKSAY